MSEKRWKAEFKNTFVESWARTGGTKDRSGREEGGQLISQYGGLSWETERPGESRDDRNTTCGRKQVGNRDGASGQQLEPEWTSTWHGMVLRE